MTGSERAGYFFIKTINMELKIFKNEGDMVNQDLSLNDILESMLSTMRRVCPFFAVQGSYSTIYKKEGELVQFYIAKEHVFMSEKHAFFSFTYQRTASDKDFNVSQIEFKHPGTGSKHCVVEITTQSIIEKVVVKSFLVTILTALEVMVEAGFTLTKETPKDMSPVIAEES